MKLFRLFSFILVLFACSTSVSAYSEVEAVRSHTNNWYLKELPADNAVLTKGEAIKALMEFYQTPLNQAYLGNDPELRTYFKDTWPASPYYPYVNTACEKQILTCADKHNDFRASDPIRLDAFLKIYYELKYLKEGPNYIPNLYQEVDKPWYYTYMQEAKKRGLIDFYREIGTLTRSELLYILHKEANLMQYMNAVPTYFNGMVLDGSQITTDRYHNVEELEQIIQNYSEFDTYATNRRNETNSKVEANRLLTAQERMKSHRAKFQGVYDEVKANPLRYDPRFTPEDKIRFAEVGVKEVLGSGYYDYSTHASYRKQNVREGALKFHDVVLAPDEEFNYWNHMAKRGFGGIVNGWVLLGTEEVWAWGGGLCGTATLVFRGAWHAGLEIIERNPHSIYYRGLYNTKYMGLDAAVYRPGLNLRFKNNTGAPVLLYVKFENEARSIARFYVLGTKNFKDLDFEGYYKDGRAYVQKRIFTFFDGSTREEEIRSVYGNM